VDRSLLPDVIDVYQVLMFVSIFSGIRCLYQGVIIYNQHTKWLTIGMAVRLTGMYLLSLYFIHTGVNSGVVGAIIFLTGMIIEATISFSEGRLLVRSMPEKAPQHAVETKKQVFTFYRPLLMSAFITVLIGPAINAMLGKTANAQLAIASFAIAGSLVMLMTSFFSYFHQIVLNFYRTDPAIVKRFTLTSGFLPAVLIGIIAFSPIGSWFMEHVMAVQGALLDESRRALQAFVLLTLVMPWLDALNGLILLKGQTRLILGSQTFNLVFTVITLLLLVWLKPGLNGTIGAWSQSVGMAAEFAFVAIRLRFMKPMDTALAGEKR
jgi:Na+-driven multidrug efflux pump